MKRLLTITYAILTIILLQEVIAETDNTPQNYKYPSPVQTSSELNKASPENTFFLKDIRKASLYEIDTSIVYGRDMSAEGIFLTVKPKKNDGKTAFSLTVKDVPVEGYWSVGVYDQNIKMLRDESGLYAYNNSSADKNADGSVTIHFGAKEGAINNLSIEKGWCCIIRMYKPKKEIISGEWQFPLPKPMNKRQLQAK